MCPSIFNLYPIMILTTFNKVKEINNLEDLTKLSNKERLELFGFIYPNSMVKNYGKVNNNHTLTIGMVKLLAKVIEHQHNITTIIKELLSEDADFLEELIESPYYSVEDFTTSERLIDAQPDTISKRKYLRDKDARDVDFFRQTFISLHMTELSVILQKILWGMG